MPIRDPNATPTVQADPQNPAAAPPAPVVAPPQAPMAPTPQPSQVIRSQTPALQNQGQGPSLQDQASAGGGFRSMEQIRQAAGTPTDLAQAISRNLFNIGFGYMAEATGNIGYLQMGQDIGNLLQNRWWRAEADQFASREGQAMMGGAQAAMQRWQAQVTPRSIQKPDGTVIEGVLRDLNDPNSAVSISTPEGHQVLAQANAGMANTIKDLTSNYIQAALKYRDNPYIRDTAHALLKSEYDWMGHITDAYDNARAAGMQQQQFESEQELHRATVAHLGAQAHLADVQAQELPKEVAAKQTEAQAALTRAGTERAMAPKTVTQWIQKTGMGEWAEPVDDKMKAVVDEESRQLAAADNEDIDNLAERASRDRDPEAIEKYHNYVTEARGKVFARVVSAARPDLGSPEEIERKLMYDRDFQQKTGVSLPSPESKTAVDDALKKAPSKWTEQDANAVQRQIELDQRKLEYEKSRSLVTMDPASKQTMQDNAKQLGDKINRAKQGLQQYKKTRPQIRPAQPTPQVAPTGPPAAPQRPGIVQTLFGQLPTPEQ